MDAEQVVDKILAEANSEAEKIKGEAEAKVRELKSGFDSELADYRGATEQLAQKAGEEKLERMLATARMANRKECLTAKVNLLGEVFDAALQKVKALADDRHEKLIMELLLKAVETGDEEVIIGKEEKRITDKTVRNINRQLGPGFKGNLRLSTDRADIDGGFILRRGNIRINVSVEVLIGEIRDKIEMDLAKELFAV